MVDLPASGVSDENLLVLQISEPLLWNCLVGLMLSIAVEGMVRFYGGMNVLGWVSVVGLGYGMLAGRVLCCAFCDFKMGS